MLLKVVQYNGTHMDVDVVDTIPADFHTGVATSIFVTVMSELGDKSFFMSAILAMHHSRTFTFIGSMLGQIIMTGVAVTLGMAASFIPEIYTKWLSCICMSFFGLKMLKDGFGMSFEEETCAFQEGKLDEEINKKFKELENEKQCHTQKDSFIQHNEESEDEGISVDVNDSMDIGGKNRSNNPSTASSSQGSRRNSAEGVLIKAFTLSFLGEWGDRSQIATILLASNENPYGVAVGSVVGHIVCSLTAVIGGRLIGQKFPVKTMTQAGGVVFLFCAASSVLFE